MYVADLIGEDGNDEHHSQPDEEGQGHRLCRVALVLLSLLHTYIHTLKVLKSKMMSSYTHILQYIHTFTNTY